ncbi:LmbE family N-acetylglucosaminyl deacetylase [Pseudonocardia sediminis]|uniref:LmbE family N-acetylglucosaminyl deacetylase n=1 Tax=Pseudonocardia sediminis TaxID=1397368 RepID=A0A4V2FQQ6_PSEST|nr:LmbE family N-acetylglucosaminyl deacetylase [Pseudonocardia sediminis]
MTPPVTAAGVTSLPAGPHGRVATAVAVSPHLDDAVFSAGATLAALAASGWRVLVLTCFTASVPDPRGFALSTQLDKGLGPDVDYMALRRDEDRAACAVLGARPVHLPLAEAPHRGYDSAAALFDGVRPDDDAARALPPLLAPHLAAADLVLAPQAIGDHADHRVVTEAVRALAPAAWWWRDVPYVARNDGRPWWAVPDGPDRGVDVVATLPGKTRAARCYATQVGFQFGGDGEVAATLRRIAADEGSRLGAGCAVEAFRIPGP